MMHFSRSITQYRSHGRFHGRFRRFLAGFFLICVPVQVRKLCYFFYLTWFLRFAMAQERSFHIETFKIIVALSLRITKCSMTYNKVMNFHDFLDYMTKSSKCGPHASKMKSWILYRLRSTQRYPRFEEFFYRPKMAEICIFYHISTPCVIIYVYKAWWRLQSVGCFQEHFMPKQNKPAQNWKKKYHKTLFSQTKGSVFWQGNFLEDYLSNRIDCASEDCLSHR